MSVTIWQQLKQKHDCILIQAPMEDAGDSVFRQVLAHCAPPHLYYTEFINVEGLTSRGRDKIIHRLQHSRQEQPLIVQIWGQDPANFATIAKELSQTDVAGIDINMGCPERSIVRRGSCAGLINHPDRASAIIKATQDNAGHLPVSVKTRCGVGTWVTESWVSHLLSHDLSALTIHGRIAKEMSHKPADWDQIGLAAQLTHQLSPDTVIIGNGDVQSVGQANQLSQQYNLDGVMIGRAALFNPWVFHPSLTAEDITLTQRLNVLELHLKLWDQAWHDHKNFHQMRRYYKMYLRNEPGVAELRATLMTLDTAADTITAITNWRHHHAA